MASESPKVLTIQLEAQVGGTGIKIDYGTHRLEKQIPNGDGMLRLSVIFNSKNEIESAELVTEKL